MSMKPPATARPGGSGVAQPRQSTASKPGTAPAGAKAKHQPEWQAPKPADVKKPAVAPSSGSGRVATGGDEAPSPRSRTEMASPALQAGLAGIAGTVADGSMQSLERGALGLLQSPVPVPGTPVTGFGELRADDLQRLLQSAQASGMTPSSLQGLLQSAQVGGMTPGGPQGPMQGGGLQGLLQSAQAQAGGLQGMLQQSASGASLAPGNLNLLAAMQQAAAQGGGQLQGLQQGAQGGVAGLQGLLNSAQSGGVGGLQGLLSAAAQGGSAGGLQGPFGGVQLPGNAGDLQQSLMRLGGGLASAFPAGAVTPAAVAGAAVPGHRHHADLWARLEGSGATTLMSPGGGVLSPSMVNGHMAAAGGPAPAPAPRPWPADAKPRISPERRIEVFVEMARAYTWMHGRARECEALLMTRSTASPLAMRGESFLLLALPDNAASQNAVIITTTVTVLSYVSGGLALGSAGTTYKDQLTLFAAVLSLLVGAIAGASRRLGLPFALFELSPCAALQRSPS